MERFVAEHCFSNLQIPRKTASSAPIIASPTTTICHRRHGVVELVGVGGGERARERDRERERETETPGYEPLPEAHTVVTGEGGACSLPAMGGG